MLCVYIGIAARFRFLDRKLEPPHAHLSTILLPHLQVLIFNL